MAEEVTVTVRYLGFCGIAPPKGRLEDMKSFDYSEQAPASICKPPVSEALWVWIDSIVKSHQPEIFADRPWQCVNCDKPARELVQASRPVLWNEHGAPGIADAGPVVMDVVAPICVSGGDCDREGTEMALQGIGSCFEGPQTVVPSCQKCGKLSDFKPCSGGCKVVG
jgi:hypothetical protein